MVSKLRSWINGAAKIKYGSYDRLGEGKRVKDPKPGGRICLRSKRGTEKGSSNSELSKGSGAVGVGGRLSSIIFLPTSYLVAASQY